MISQQSYNRERRRLSIAEGRFTRARAALPANPFAHDVNGAELMRAAYDAAAKLRRVAREGLAVFELEGFPDSWARWERLAEDARFFTARHGAELELLEELDARRSSSR